MSYSTILVLEPNKQPQALAELRNSWGSAPVIWMQLCEEFFETTDWFTVSQDLWPKWKDTSIEEYKRALLMMTFDKAIVKRENFSRAAKDIRKWLEIYPRIEGSANHWAYIAEIYETADYPAIGVWQTSVTDCPFCGPWNEEKEEYELIDWDELYDIYEELDGLNS